MITAILVLGCSLGKIPEDEANGDVTTENTVSEAETPQETEPEEDQERSSIIGTIIGAFTGERSASVDGLSIAGSGYEGTVGTGNFNYGEALQKSILFYELQRSGALPEDTRTNWRGDSCLMDGSDAGLDLTGGWFDAGDHVKFNLPMAYTVSMLGWSLYEDRDAYEESGQLSYQLNNIRYVCDYLIKCHPEDEVYYYQVGDGGSDHSWWGPAELVEQRTSRPSYKVTADSPGSAVTAQAAAALAVSSIIFEQEDASYADLCLQHARSLYAFSDKYKSDAGYTAANGFYTSNSGYYDELSWAACWLYLATGEKTYLKAAEEYYPKACQDYNWAVCWDDVHIGAALLLARITEDSFYKTAVQNHLDWWTVGYDGSRITYTPKGLAWLDTWGSLRYATTTAFVAAVYSEWEGCPSDKASTYWDFAVSQADYALGSTGFSYMVGFGDAYPQHVHHRTAQGSYCNNMNEPKTARHILMGALAGGPDAGDNYTDEVSNYTTNEVACDYNAGFTGLLAKLYTRYHGQTLKDFGAVEEVGDEFRAEASVNVQGNDFVEIKAFVYNESAWPVRGCEDLELRYFVDLSEVYDAGGRVDDVVITTNYVQDVESTEFVTWDEESHIYYLCIAFADGTVYPGGQENYKKEVQVRMRNTLGVWDDSNDYSHAGLSVGTLTAATMMAVYERGELVYGSEPAAGEHAGQAVTPAVSDPAEESQQTSSGTTVPVTSTAQAGDLSAKIEYTGSGADAGSISGTLILTNTGSGIVALKDLKIRYYLTNDNNGALMYSCYYCGLQGADGSHTSLSGVSGDFEETDEYDSDAVCVMSFNETGGLAPGGELSLNFCIYHADWSCFDMTNDYSALSAENIMIEY